MEQALISKKELLELTGISYGQLYRWKRKNLIPEDWFIRKSAFTGQETFFPKAQILSRIEKIKNMKEDLSLDDLADVFSPALTVQAFSHDDLAKRNIVSSETWDFITTQGIPLSEPLGFDQILFLYMLDKLFRSGEINREEGRALFDTLSVNYPKLAEQGGDLYLLRKMGVSICLLTAAPGQIHLENGVKVVVRLPINGCIEELKIKLSEEIG